METIGISLAYVQPKLAPTALSWITELLVSQKSSVKFLFPRALPSLCKWYQVDVFSSSTSVPCHPISSNPSASALLLILCCFFHLSASSYYNYFITLTFVFISFENNRTLLFPLDT